MSESVRLDGSSERRRAALAEFLKTRRARLSPADVGLPSGGRRRTPGLRREEVALLANVGVSWYTSLEQGREAHASMQVLEGITDALKLSPEERQHLFVLAEQIPAPGEPSLKNTVSPALRRVLEDLRTSPAHALGAQWDLVYWNAAADLVFDFSSGAPPPHERNLLWGLFTDPEERSRRARWEESARAALARFRADFARYPADARFERLVEDLKRESPEFREWWPRYDIVGELDGRKEFIHPKMGHLILDQTTLRSPAYPDLKIMLYAPSSEACASPGSKQP